MKRIFTFVFCSALLASCSSPNSEDKNSEVGSAIEADDASEADLKKELSDIDREERELQKAEEATKTSMSFDKMKIEVN